MSSVILSAAKDLAIVREDAREMFRLAQHDKTFGGVMHGMVLKWNKKK